MKKTSCLYLNHMRSRLVVSGKARLSFESFQEMVQSSPVVANNYTSEFLSRKMDHNTATFSGNVRSFNSEKVAVTYVLMKEGDRWVIQEFHF